MKRKIIESMSVEEAFKSLNSKPAVERGDEQLIESTEQYELSTLVKDSIDHLVNDLGNNSMADDFGDDVCADLENNYDIYVPQDPVKYADWCSAVKCEVSRQLTSEYDDLGIDTRTGKPFGMHYDIDAPEDDNIDEMLAEENSLIPQVNIRDIDLDKSNYKFALWVSGEVAAYYRNYDAAEEALDNLKGQGFDLAIIDADSNKTLYADWY